ncbi:hypothetical protein ACSFBX_15550 [Variovorax sp. RB2P76]|jgi:hypothetical protein|uniref:hypothetical protein n=1 Tax=unclassified Variovorax TaxID=663243 RepID=UPI003F46B219
MNASPPANAVDVGALARCAALDLNPERRAAVEAVLSAWIPAANELSRKMSDAAYRELMPVTAFAHAHELPEDGA